MSSDPVYRRPRSHAYACRCPRCAASMPRMKNGDYGILGPLALTAGVVAVTGFWPAMVWHGYNETGGWRWDIHSTVAVAVYWGVIAFTAVLIAAGNRPAKVTAPPPSPGPQRTRAPAPPACRHLDAGPLVNRFTAVPLAWFCAECDTGLPAEFGRLARPCCGTLPGGGHLHNCFHRKGWLMSETADPGCNPEFDAFRQEFLDHILDSSGVPEDQKDLWRDLR